MALKTSTALLAAMFALANGSGMAFAQTATDTTPAAPTAPATPATPEAPAAATEAPATTEAPAATPEAPAATTAPAAEAPAATPAPATTEAPAAGAPEATPAAPANGEPQVGQNYIKATFNDWSQRCIKTPDGKDPCELYQLLKDKDGGAVAEASVVPMSGQVSAIITFVAPLETDLQNGLVLQVDTAKPQAYPFMVCAQVGCVSRIGLTGTEIGALKKGKGATVKLRPFGAPESQMVSVNLSLSGFTAGLDAVTKDMAAIDAVGKTPEAPKQIQSPIAPKAN